MFQGRVYDIESKIDHISSASDEVVQMLKNKVFADKRESDKSDSEDIGQLCLKPVIARNINWSAQVYVSFTAFSNGWLIAENGKDTELWEIWNWKKFFEN